MPRRPALEASWVPISVGLERQPARPQARYAWFPTNHTAASDVVLAIEIVSPGSESEDRYVKPGQYARNGIPHFWRIELDPDIAVHTFRLASGIYVDAGVFHRDGRITSPALPWLDVSVDQLPDWTA